MSRENYNNLIFGVILLLLIGVSLLTFWNVNKYVEEVRWVRHSNLVIAQIEKVLSIVKDAETGHRGYQLTRDSVFLVPYQTSVESIYEELKTLDSLFLKEAAQEQRVDSLRALIDKQYRIIGTILKNEEESKRFIDRYEVNLLIVGRENMEEIRGVCKRMVDFEERVLLSRLDDEYTLKNIAPATLLLYGFVAIAVAGFMYVKLNDELRRRRKTEMDLKIKMSELDQKERVYRALFERSIDPIFLMSEDFKMFDVNPSFTRLFNYETSKIDTLSVRDLFVDPERYEEFKRRLTRENHVKDFEVELKTSENRKLTCLINCVFIPDLEDKCCYQGIIHDMTMRKKAERELLVAEKLSTTGRIARTIAHEVRNPLTNLNLALDQLKGEFEESNTTRVYTDILDRNLGRIEVLISDLLRSSRPKDLQLEEVPLHKVLDETIELVRDRISLHEMQLKKEFNSLPSVCVDKELIKIALTNIMVNAVEAMEPGKGILKVAAVKNTDHVSVSISDNGKGMPEEELECLFDPFYSAKKGGMGLGLTSTQNILNSHKISIEVTSQPNRGTTFLILFKIGQTA